MLVTGHNLDDEAAVLFGNTLRWDVEYLARQLPVLPARDGFPKKVKPLVRLTERETAAWCIVRGIDYLVDECPMAAGNKHLGYKAALNAIEATSPGSEGRVLPRLPREHGAAAGRPCRRRRAASSAHVLAAAARPTTGERVRLLPSGGDGGRPRTRAGRAGRRGRGGARR